MKKYIKKVFTMLTLFAFAFMTFAPYLAYAESNPKKGDLKYDGTTAYIGADEEGKDTGLITKVDQYTSANNGSVEVSAGLFNKAENNDVKNINELSENDVEVRKIVTKINDDGKYKVEFQVRGKGTKLQVKAPVYVVVVFDNSNSMAPEQDSRGTCVNWKSKEDLQKGVDTDADKGRCYDKWDKAIAGAKEFARIINNNIPSANIALVSFGGQWDNKNYSDATVAREFDDSNFATLNATNSSLKISMPGFEQEVSAGGTNLEAGLRSARELLENTDVVPANALKYVVVMGDGEPTYYYAKQNEYYDGRKKNAGTTIGNGSKYDSTAHQRAVDEADNIKKNLNAKIYSIGYEVDTIENAKTVLNDISSNIKNEKGEYTGGYYAAGSVETIANKFTDIANEIIKDAGINAYINDNIGPAFTGTGEGVSEDGTKYESQIIPSIYEKWTTLGSFTIQIDRDSPTGWYKTNKGFTLTYYDVVNEKQRVIECNDDPEVYWVQNTYDYEVRFYYEDDYGNYVEDTNLRKDELKAAHNEIVSELTSEIMDNTHLKEGYLFVEVKDENEELINEVDNKYSIVVDKDAEENIIRVYYQKAYTLSITKLVDEYDPTKKEMNKEFNFEIKLTDNSNNPITGTYLYKLNDEINRLEITFDENGIGTISLKHNDKITFINLPKNINYEITELNTDGYVVEITYPNGSNDMNTTTGTLNLDSNQEVSFLNITGYILPDTGSNQTIILMMVTMILLGTPIIYLIYSFINKRYISWYL